MKNFRRIFMIFLVLMLALGLFACGGESECTEHKDEDKNGKCDICEATVELPKEDETESVEFVKDGEAKFNFVVSSTASGSVNLAVDKLIKELKALGVEAEKITDRKDGGEIEILIGDVSGRGAEYDIDEHTLGLKGYMVKLVGKKLIVVGGSDDALANAIEVLKSDFLGIKKSTETIENVTISSSMNVEEIQNNYIITNISVDGVEINTFKIKVDKSNKNMLSAATSFQNAIYAAKGYWLDIVDANDAGDGNFVVFDFVDDAGIDGYKVYVDGGNLIFETEFPNKVKEATEVFVTKNISSVVGKGVDFAKKFSYTATVRYVYYSEFKKIDDTTGKQNDFATIKACHDYANEWGHTVRADANAVYNIGLTGGVEIKIKTDVEWGNATFKIDDKCFEVSDKERTKSIFVVASSFSDWKTVYDEESDYVKLMNESFKGGDDTTKLPFAPGYKALVNVIDNNNYAYNRWGTHATATPPYQREIVVVEPDGTLSDNTSFLLGFTGVTKLEIYRIDDETVTLSGGTFITDANAAPPVYTSYNRNIGVNRANTVIKNVVHQIVGEGETGAPYSGFIQFTYTANLLCENLTLQGHKSYQDYKEDGSVNSTMGSYDITGNHSNNIIFKNCIQSNFYTDETKTAVTPESVCWGIMGTNHNKNLMYDGCTLSRLDAHAGVQNVIIRDTNITYIKLTGGGTALIENCTIYEPNKSSTGLVELRADYGSTWRGDIIIKDCFYLNGSEGDDVTLINGSWNNWDFGNYITYLPNVTIDNLYIKSPKSVNYIFSKYTGSNGDVWLDQEFLKDGTKNENPMNVNAVVTIKNNKNGYVYDGCLNNGYINDKIIFKDNEND